VRLVHSRTNAFRYDENITFVKRELLPRIEALRDAKARAVGGDWPESFHITMSFAGGTPARISAIQAALRPYRPQTLVSWRVAYLTNRILF
jgi:hypothetical protein